MSSQIETINNLSDQIDENKSLVTRIISDSFFIINSERKNYPGKLVFWKDKNINQNQKINYRRSENNQVTDFTFYYHDGMLIKTRVLIKVPAMEHYPAIDVDSNIYFDKNGILAEIHKKDGSNHPSYYLQMGNELFNF